MSVATERERMTWDDLGTGARELAAQVVADGYEPGFILGIARGGLLTAGALSYSLEVKNTFTINVEFYTGVDERLPVPMLLPPIPDPVDLHDQRVLIADDVADTGKTLELVRKEISEHVAEARCAVLYHKPRSIITPEYVWAHTERWINFPWSCQDPVVALANRDA
jgi:hypoxanthine phosphoribosyltransferase